MLEGYTFSGNWAWRASEDLMTIIRRGKGGLGAAVGGREDYTML